MDSTKNAQEKLSQITDGEETQNTRNEIEPPAPSRAQMSRWIDYMINNCNTSIEHLEYPYFWDMDVPWEMPGLLETLTSNPYRWPPLHKIVMKLDAASRYNFWQTMFENRQRIPQKELINLWYDCLTNRNSQCGHSNPDKEEIEKRTEAARNNPLLIDNPIVNSNYCRDRKPSWKFLRYLHGRRHQSLNMPEGIYKAIREDCPPMFFMILNITKIKISFSLLAMVMKYGAVNIFRYLLEEKLISDKIIPLDELCCYLTTCFKDSISVPLLTIIEELHPGTIKGFKDIFGRNLLWYSVYNKKTAWFHPNCKLTPFLIAKGCDPQNINQIGLTWQAVTEGLTLEQKKKMMQYRYFCERWVQYHDNSQKLHISQPLKNLR